MKICYNRFYQTMFTRFKIVSILLESKKFIFNQVLMILCHFIGKSILYKVLFYSKSWEYLKNITSAFIEWSFSSFQNGVSFPRAEKNSFFFTNQIKFTYFIYWKSSSTTLFYPTDFKSRWKKMFHRFFFIDIPKYPTVQKELMFQVPS